MTLTKDDKRRVYRTLAKIYVLTKVTQFKLINIATDEMGEPFNYTTLLKYIKEARQ